MASNTVAEHVEAEQKMKPTFLEFIARGPVMNLRRAAEHDDAETIRMTKNLFKIQ